MDKALKKCPFCAEDIQEEAIVCRYCRRDVSTPSKKTDRVHDQQQTGDVATFTTLGLNQNEPNRALGAELYKEPSEITVGNDGMDLRLPIYLLAGFGLVVALFLFHPEEPSPRVETPVAHAKEVESRPGVGEKGYLSLGNSLVILTVDEEGMDQLIKSGIAKDMTGLQELMLNGQAFAVADRTEVLVIDMDFSGKVKVRVESGTSAGRAGWVPFEWVHKP